MLERVREITKNIINETAKFNSSNCPDFRGLGQF